MSPLCCHHFWIHENWQGYLEMNARSFIWGRATSCIAFILGTWLLALVTQLSVYRCDTGIAEQGHAADTKPRGAYWIGTSCGLLAAWFRVADASRWLAISRSLHIKLK